VKVAALSREIDLRLRARGRAARRRRAAWYTPSALEPIGVATADLRKIVRDVAARVRREKPEKVVALARALVARRTLEGRQAAYELLRGRADVLGSLTTKGVEALGRGMDNWASVDAFACGVSGRCWRAGQVPDSAVRRWARSRDRWWRRAAVVSTVPLNLKAQGGRGDAARTLDICARVVRDREECVLKALSWALRVLASRSRRPVQRFLAEHGARLPPWLVREVRRKLRTGRK